MKVLFEFVSPPHSCSYLPDQHSQMAYTFVRELSVIEFRDQLITGQRRFGYAVFRPDCPHCNRCQSIRVLVAEFAPNRSQRRALKSNPDIRLVIGNPEATEEKLDLYDRFHAFQSEHVGWREQPPKDVGEYVNSFVDNPFPTEEWCYYLGDRLVGVGYVDVLPEAMSAIYFFHDPDLRDRSLGTFNVLSVLGEAKKRSVPYVYLGYYVEGCRSLEYKATFRPNEAYDLETGMWSLFRER